VVTFPVLNLDKSILVKEEQPENNWDISSILFVFIFDISMLVKELHPIKSAFIEFVEATLNDDRSIEDKDEQFLNILDIKVTLLVSKFLVSIDLIFEQLSNILLVSVTLEVTNLFKRKVSKL
jgi:hypothetical protein